MVSFDEENAFLQKTPIVLTWIGLLADLTDTTNLVGIISSIQPTEIYNLAAQSHVKVSFDMAEYTVCLLTVRSVLAKSRTDARLRTG